MKKILHLSILIVTLLMLSACTSLPLYNVDKHKIDNPASSQKVYSAIKQAGRHLGWKITSIKPGKARGKLYLRKHVAVVNIYYNSRSFSIHYVSSKNLKYDGQKKTIHKNYNSWVQNLEREIDVRL